MKTFIKVSLFVGIVFSIILAIILVPYLFGELGELIFHKLTSNSQDFSDYYIIGWLYFISFATISFVIVGLLILGYSGFSNSDMVKEIESKVDTYEKKKLELKDAKGQLSINKMEEFEGCLSFLDEVERRKTS